MSIRTLPTFEFHLLSLLTSAPSPEKPTGRKKTRSSQSRKRKLDELLAAQKRMTKRGGPAIKRRRTRNSHKKDGEEEIEEELESKGKEERDEFSHEEQDETPPAPPTPLIEKLFQGDTLSSIRCLTYALDHHRISLLCLIFSCGSVSTRLEPFFDLSLPIERKQNLLWCVLFLSFFISPSTVLTRRSLSNYVAEETMSGTNQYYCSSCAKKTDAIRHSQFSSLPEILSIHLKRFTYNNQYDRPLSPLPDHLILF